MSLILNGTNGLSDVDGSASTPAIRGTDTNTGIFFPAADTIAFAEGGAEVMRIDSSGNVGIGTSSPVSDAKLTISSDNTESHIFLQRSGSGRFDGSIGLSGGSIVFKNGADSSTVAGLTERMRIDGDTSNLMFNSGYGSVATAYGCRAWVNFNGTGTVAIRASGNVSSITDNGTGDYTVNFANAMPDANYATSWNSGMKQVVWGLPLFAGLSGIGNSDSQSTTQVRVISTSPQDAGVDNPQCSVAIFR
jgi:hypothetical protein